MDFCLAWALIGEWTSRVLFPVSKGPWPRDGHAGALLQTSNCDMGMSGPSLTANDAWSRTGPQSPGRSYVPGHGSSETCYYSCLWRSQDRWKDLLPRLHLKGGFLWRLLCSALWINRLCGQVLGSSCRHYHRLQGATSHAFGKRETAHALVLATVGCNQCPELCLVPMACWNRCGTWTRWA